MGGKQLGFGDYEQSTAKKRTKREKLLAEMEAVVPRKALFVLIEPHYPIPAFAPGDQVFEGSCFRRQPDHLNHLLLHAA